MSGNYIMPVKAVKNIVSKELKSFYSHIRGEGNIRYTNEATQYIIEYGYKMTLERLESCNDYESLEDFIGEWYRMSLENWIESL